MHAYADLLTKVLDPPHFNDAHTPPDLTSDLSTHPLPNSPPPPYYPSSLTSPHIPDTHASPHFPNLHTSPHFPNSHTYRNCRRWG